MVSIPTLVAFTAGELVTGTKLTSHTKGVMEAAVLNKPFCHINPSSTQSLTTAINTELTLNTEVEDTDNMGDVASNRIIIRTAGLYRITGQVVYAANGTQYRLCEVRVNGTAVCASMSSAISTLVAALNATVTKRLAVNDLITLRAQQASGGNLSTSNTMGNSFLQAEFISQ